MEKPQRKGTFNKGFMGHYQKNYPRNYSIWGI